MKCFVRFCNVGILICSLLILGAFVYDWYTNQPDFEIWVKDNELYVWSKDDITGGSVAHSKYDRDLFSKEIEIYYPNGFKEKMREWKLDPYLEKVGVDCKWRLHKKSWKLLPHEIGSMSIHTNANDIPLPGGGIEIHHDVVLEIYLRWDTDNNMKVQGYEFRKGSLIKKVRLSQ